MSKELPKAYEPKNYEDNIYQSWEDSGLFNPENLDGDPYAIMMPPPNVTGILHLGHALENSLMDVMARYQRMSGKKVLLLPGTDHAAVATQARVEDNLAKEGIKNPREHFGREGLLEKIREFAENSKSTILGQVRRMGTSADWDSLAYTFDSERNKAVNAAFTKMHEDGLIYRGYRVVNWSVKGQSTCSDDELVHVERQSKLYTFKYHADVPIVIATTRPETKLGDTAIAVHPEGKWKEYIGQEFVVENVGQTGHTLTLKVIGDEHVDDSFGTGALGVTPAHSQIDFDMYTQHKTAGNDIGLIQVIGKDGKMTANAGSEYKGLSVDDAREKFVQYLRDNNLLEAEEEITQNVGTSDRFKDIVEALPMDQWFVNVNEPIRGKGKSLKQLMKDAVVGGLNGDPNKIVKITPERFEKVYFNWIDNLRDWCVSRQIWWGHRIPAWKNKETDEVYVGVEPPKDIENWDQDEDTLDTWFSSGLWTFSTLGWDGTDDNWKNEFHPTAWMQMGHEILFFWMARMILFSAYLLDDIPFKDVYIHGMVRDKDGRKFSKSLGNGIDPIDVIEEYGTDALRLSLLSGISPGNDSKFYEEKVEGMRNLVNKIWNISRYILSTIDVQTAKNEYKKENFKLSAIAETDFDKSIVNKLNYTKFRVNESFKKFEFSQAIESLIEFTRADFADKYIESAKVEKNKDILLFAILSDLLKLWHPFIPFVTQEIWNNVYDENPLMIAEYPNYHTGRGLKRIKDSENIWDIIQKVRNFKAESKISPGKSLNIQVNIDSDEFKLFERNKDNIESLSKVKVVGRVDSRPEKHVSLAVNIGELYISLEGAIDTKQEKTRIKKELASVEPYVAQMEKKLSNESFVNNAPEAVVAGEQQKLAEAKEKVEKLQNQLQAIS